MLAVWLPLNGNLNNQGICPVTVTSGTAAYVTGKIGQGLNLSKRVSFNCSALAGCKKFSVAFWVMLEDNENITSNWQDIIGFTDQTSDNSTNGQLRAETCYATNQSPSNFGVHWHDNATYAMTTGNLIKHYTGDRGIWHHCVMTIDSEGKMGGYVDGNFITEYATNNPGGHLTGAFWIGENNNIAGRINDVRIYKNQILTSKEAKKLSQGLVLHLPLSRKGFGMDNIIPNSANFSLWSKEGTSSVTLEEDGWYHIQSTNTNTSRYGCYYNLTFPEVGTYTLSAMVKTDWHIGFQALNAFNWTGQTVYGTGAERIVSYTVTTTEENNKCRIYIFGQNTINSTYIKWIKVEKGDKATPWIPNSTDALYTKMGLNDNIEKDISGYKHNGTVTGTLTYNTDTPINNLCTHIGATNTKINISGLSVSGFSNSYSFAWWGKRTSNSPMFWGFSNGCRLNGMYLGSLWNTGDSSNNPLYNIGTTTQVTAPSVNVWHHYVMTGNGTKCYVYLDGELWAEAKTCKPISGTSIYINGWNTSTSYSSNNTDIADFRMYATALSADEVLDLYEKR